MNRDQPTTVTNATGSVQWSNGLVRLRDDAVFGLGNDQACYRFLDSALRHEAVAAILLDRTRSSAEIRLKPGSPIASFLDELARALRSPATGPGLALPRGCQDSRCTIHRHRELLTTCEVLTDRPGLLRFRHPTLFDHPRLGRAAIRLIATLPGVQRSTLTARGFIVSIHYDSQRIPIARLLRVAEETLDSTGWWDRELPTSTPTRFGLANTNLVIAALADLALPILAPVSAVMLIGTNLRTFRAAGLQIRKRKLGLPVLYSVIVGTTLAGGQFLASALMSWCFKYWQGRLRNDLAEERRRLLDECLPLPRLARLVTPDDTEVLVQVGRLRSGDVIALSAEESVPADSRVTNGEAIVDEQSLRGFKGATRKRSGDLLLAGSLVMAGSVRARVTHAPGNSRASVIGRSLVAATSPAAGTLSPTKQGEAFAERTIGPTLATAGFGLLVGDLAAAGAILRPDYATGPGVAVPLQTLHDVAACVCQGLVIRTPDALTRLAEANVLFIDDSPALRARQLEVAQIQTRIPEELVLQYAASAYHHLADQRASALAEAVRSRHAHLLALPVVEFNGGVTVAHGKHRIRVRETGPEHAGPLVVEIDKTDVGWIEFQYSSRIAGLCEMERLREQGLDTIVLLSESDEQEASRVSSAIGATAHAGRLSPGEKARVIRDARLRGLRPVFLGDCRRHPQAAAEAHVAVSLAPDLDLEHDPGDVLLLQPRFDLVSDLWSVAKEHNSRVRSTEHLILWPNVLCVAGAFFLGATALTSVVVSNLGTYGIYNRASGSLQSLRAKKHRRVGFVSPTS